MEREEDLKIERRRAKLLRKIYSGEHVWEVYASDKDASLDDVKGDLQYLLEYGSLGEEQTKQALEDIQKQMCSKEGKQSFFNLRRIRRADHNKGIKTEQRSEEIDER